MRIGKQQEEGLCESVTMVAQDGQTVRSKPMTLGELQHFLQDIRGLLWAARLEELRVLLRQGRQPGLVAAFRARR